MAILTAEARVRAKTRNAPRAGSPLCVRLQNGGVVHSTQTRQTVHRHVVQVYEMGGAVGGGEGSVQGGPVADAQSVAMLRGVLGDTCGHTRANSVVSESFHVKQT